MLALSSGAITSYRCTGNCPGTYNDGSESASELAPGMVIYFRKTQELNKEKIVNAGNLKENTKCCKHGANQISVQKPK